ncbi:transaldolase family protein, partial [Holdemania filiformis]|uniref:transaldolase family protein n=1 Tax=Holdemania filiformis TaxID=61171 RepID=UPI0022DFD85D
MNKLYEMVTRFPQTEVWNDSCSCKELQYAIDNGASGATTNPVIVGNVLKKELPEWEETIREIISTHPASTEDDAAWEVIKALGAKASRLLLPMLATVPNSQIKAPTSQAGVEAFEELTYRGVSINATVSFTCAQAIAVAEAVERGLARREAEGLSTAEMHPVCTIMAGRTDDYLKAWVKQHDVMISAEALDMAGVAVVKNAYRLYKERGYRTKLLVAAFRNQHHWEEFIGGDIVLTIT